MQKAGVTRLAWRLPTTITAIIALGVALSMWRGFSQPDALIQHGGVSPFDLLAAGEDDNFARTAFPWNFQFPADYGRHGEFRTEWWYLAGVLTDERRERLGAQFALVRLGLRAEPRERPSRWATSEIYAGLFTVSDPIGGNVRTHRRTARAALGLAGAALRPSRVWVENWRLEQIGLEDEALGLRVRVSADDLELNLDLHSAQPVINSDDLRSQGFAESAPFHLYLQPRLKAKGTLRVGERRTNVTGNLSLEHAWGELPLPGGPVARDRFVLHFADGRELLCLRTHRVDGSGRPTTTGLLIDIDDHASVLTNTEIKLTPTSYWTSAQTHVRYPTRWALRVIDKGIEVELIPYWENQEGVVWESFWAGPVGLRGASGAMLGDGFVQLNGYEGL